MIWWNGLNQFNNRYQYLWWYGKMVKSLLIRNCEMVWRLNGELVRSLTINGHMVKQRMNDGGAKKWCMFDISVVRSSYYLSRRINQQEWQKYFCDNTIQCFPLWWSGQPLPSLWWVLFPNPFYAGETNEIRTGGVSFLWKKGSRVYHLLWFLNHEICHHTLSSFLFIDLAVENCIQLAWSWGDEKPRSSLRLDWGECQTISNDHTPNSAT